jgi:hypothetical protein
VCNKKIIIFFTHQLVFGGWGGQNFSQIKDLKKIEVTLAFPFFSEIFCFVQFHEIFRALLGKQAQKKLQ